MKKNISAYDGLKEIRQFRDVYPSKQQLLYVAKVHNKKFGFDDVKVVDVDMTMDKGRQKVLQAVGKPKFKVWKYAFVDNVVQTFIALNYY